MLFIMSITVLRSESTSRELGFKFVATYFAAVTAGLGLLALLAAIIRRRSRSRLGRNIYELDASVA
jgi:hypothetical protein